jgi:hypothetical protein
MTNSQQPVLQRMIRGCSRLLLWVGAVVFLFGDAFLYEIKHVNFFESAAIGICRGNSSDGAGRGNRARE